MKLARALAFGIALACAALTAVAPTALAQANPRTYAVAISPKSVTAGATTKFNIALKNTSTIRSGIESANIVPPSGFTLSRASLTERERGTAEVVRNVLRLRNISVPPGSTFHVLVTATAPTGCTDSSSAWRSEAKPHGNFTGEEFTLGSDGSSLTTVVACALQFVTEPNNAVVGQTITGTAFDPTGPPLTVEVLDGQGNVVSSSSAPVSIALGSNPGGSTLSGTTTENAVNGVATFSDLTLDKAANGYTLVASSPGLGSTTSTPFDEDNTAVTCPPGQSCSTTLTTTVSEFQVTANPGRDGGTLSESVDVGTALTCAEYTAADPNWFEFTVSTVNRVKLITYTVRNTSPEGIQFCLGAPYEFTTRSGAPAKAGTLPDGSSGFIGLLPSCPASGPCVQSITSSPDESSSTGVDTIVTVRIPDGLPGDPWGRM